MISLKQLQNGQEKYNKEKSGSITVFMALTLVLVFSFLFSMVEAARVNGLRELAKRKLFMETQSLFGAYNQELWENYGLLFLDMSYGTGEPDVRLMEEHIMEEAYGEGDEQHFYQMALKDAQVEAFVLATDWGGAEFKRQACEAAREELAEESVEAIRSQLSVWEELESDSEELEQKWQEALASEEEAENYVTEESETTEADKVTEADEATQVDEVTEADEVVKADEAVEADEVVKADEAVEAETENFAGALPENPIDYVAQLKAASFLALVMEEPSQLSAKGIDIASTLDNRELFCGNMSIDEEATVDKFWFIQYLDRYFTCAADTENKGHVLDYELEYCIAGKTTDAQNLETVVNRLLLIREAANFATIMQDSQKQTLALEIAMMTVGFTGLPPLIKAMQIGVLLAWCYVESILDLRCLLSGGRVPLIKSSAEWKSDLFHIQEEVSQNTDTEGETGLNYREYLQLLLCSADEEKLTCRAMDVVERNIRLFSGNELIRMDTMVSAARIETVHMASPLFFNLIPVTQKIDGSYYFQGTQKFSY